MTSLSQTDLGRFARGALIAVGGRFAGRTLHVVGHLVIARLLGPALFGRFTIGWTLLATLGSVTTVGMDRAVIRFGTHRLAAGGQALAPTVLTALGVAGSTGGAVGLAVFSAAENLALAVFENPALAPVLRSFAPAFILFPTMKVASAATRVGQSMAPSMALESVGQPAVALAALSMLAVSGLSVLDAVLALNISLGVSLLALIWALYGLFPVSWSLRRIDFGRHRVLDMIRYGLPAGFAGSLTLLTTRLDRLFIAAFRPEVEVGLYQAASQSAVLFGLLLSGFTAILQPMVSDLYDRGRIEALDRLFKTSTRWTLFICLPLYLVMVLAPEHVMVGVYGTNFEEASSALVILATAFLVNAGTGAVGPILLMTGHQKQWAVISGSVLVLSLMANLMLVPWLGFVGAAWAAVVTTIALFVAGLRRLHVDVGIWPYHRSFLRAVVPFVGSGLVVWSLTRLLTPGLPALLTLTGAAVVVFYTLLALTGFDDEDRELFAGLTERARNRK